jgi:hypothetical protein
MPGGGDLAIAVFGLALEPCKTLLENFKARLIIEVKFPIEGRNYSMEDAQ